VDKSPERQRPEGVLEALEAGVARLRSRYERIGAPRDPALILEDLGQAMVEVLDEKLMDGNG
jgi:hypothetical protein